jgi:hypothetical protein
MKIIMQYDIQKLIEERKEGMKYLSEGFDEIRKAETEAKTKKEAEELAKLPAKPLSTEQQIELLTKSIAELTIKFEGKGE